MRGFLPPHLFFFLLLLLLPLLTSRGDDALAGTMTHPFDTLIIISSHLIRLTSPGEFRLEANMKFSSSLTPAYPQMKMSICLHVNLLQKEAGCFFFSSFPLCSHFVSPRRILERKVVGSCCPLLDIKGRSSKKWRSCDVNQLEETNALHPQQRGR